MSRLSRIFGQAAEDDRLVVSIFLTVGHPNVSESLELTLAAIESGAEIIELGVPFSDPLADGATIQASSYTALQQGITMRDCLDVATAVRGKSDAALLLMGYTNPFLAYGLDSLARDATHAGVDGLIVPDLPPDEAGEFEQALQGSNLSMVYLVAPDHQRQPTEDRGQSCRRFSVLRFAYWHDRGRAAWAGRGRIPGPDSPRNVGSAGSWIRSLAP